MMTEIMNENITFQSSPGEITGEIYAGVFEVRRALTPYMKALADADRRQFLGNPLAGEEIDSEVAELAFACSQLKVRIVSSPKWFKESNNLKNFLDQNVLIELVKAVLDVELSFKRSIQEKAQKAKEQLISPNGQQ